MKKISFKSIMFLLYLVAVVLLTVLLYPFFASLTSEAGVASLQEKVQELKFVGILLVLGLQVLQIIIAIVPGEVVEFVSGALYGPWGGLLLDLIGIALGQSLIYFLVMKLGADFAEKLTGSQAIQKFKFLQNAQKRNLLVFLLYFIPGTPKDALCYIAPLFKIPYKTFMVLSLVARIPSVVSSTFAGAAFGEGDFKETVIIYAVVAGLSVVGFLVYRQFMKGREKHGTDKC
ncbi:MAG: TVP38/TMEM64 family protein [Clostridia bacterium]|nr:TVP38/TMEM64 family protein [Clostridia bacterium]